MAILTVIYGYIAKTGGHYLIYCLVLHFEFVSKFLYVNELFLLISQQMSWSSRQGEFKAPKLYCQMALLMAQTCPPLCMSVQYKGAMN